MTNHRKVISVFKLAIVFVLGLLMLKTCILDFQDTSQLRVIVIGLLKDVETTRHQRNQLSQLLNTNKQELAIMSCDMILLKHSHERQYLSVSVYGGWCKEPSRNNTGSHMFDKEFAMSLSKFLQNASVGSFGDGPGDYKRYLDSTHLLRNYDAYDGAPHGPETSGGAVKFLDLTAPQYGLPVYDWVLSLEVAEHIPAKYEDVYIDNIVRHARLGIILSWAVPNQGGVSHVNEKPLSYVQDLLSSKGFVSDLNASKPLQDGASFPWIKKNVFVYRRQKENILIPENA